MTAVMIILTTIQTWFAAMGLSITGIFLGVYLFENLRKSSLYAVVLPIATLTLVASVMGMSCVELTVGWVFSCCATALLSGLLIVMLTLGAYHLKDRFERCTCATCKFESLMLTIVRQRAALGKAAGNAHSAWKQLGKAVERVDVGIASAEIQQAFMTAMKDAETQAGKLEATVKALKALGRHTVEYCAEVQAAEHMIGGFRQFSLQVSDADASR